MNNIKGIIFDLDGLLIDTEVLVNKAIHKMGVDIFSKEIPETFFIERSGLNRMDSHKLLSMYIDIKISETEFSEIFDRYFMKILKKRINCKTGCMELLEFLEKHNIPKAIATSSETNLAYYKLEQAGIDVKRFSCLIGADEVKHRKPAPDVYLLAASRMEIKPEDCLALEDSYHGVKSAVSANIKVICVPDIKPPCEEMQKLSMHIFPSLHKVKDYCNHNRFALI